VSAVVGPCRGEEQPKPALIPTLLHTHGARDLSQPTRSPVTGDASSERRGSTVVVTNLPQTLGPNPDPAHRVGSVSTGGGAWT